MISKENEFSLGLTHTHTHVGLLHFHVGVGESVNIHGCQVGAALHAHTETPVARAFTSTFYGFILQTDRRQELKGEEETTSLLQAVQLLVLPLRTRLHRYQGSRVRCVM